MACRALASQDKVDVAVLQETKLTGGIYTRRSSGYFIAASNAPSARQGGVALCWRGSKLFEIEETQIWGPNVVAFRLLTGKHRLYVMGCYIPPSEMNTLDEVEEAWKQCPKGFMPLLIGDLNVNLEALQNKRRDDK